MNNEHENRILATEIDNIAHVRESDGCVQSLEEHLSCVGQLTAEFANKINLSGAGAAIGLLHDFGKYSSEFQNYISSSTGRIDCDDEEWVDANLLRGKIDHSTAGAQYLWKSLKKIYPAKGAGELTAQILALCVASHHSGLIDCLNSNGDFSFKARIEKSDKKSHLSEATANADLNLKKRIDDLLNEGLVKEVIDEIRKTCNQSPNRMPVAKMFAIGMLTRFLFSCLVDADRLNSAEFNQPSIRNERLARRAYYDWNIALARFNKRINCLLSDQPIDQIRQSISDSCHQKASSPQGIFTLSVPTGGGKTLARGFFVGVKPLW